MSIERIIAAIDVRQDVTISAADAEEIRELLLILRNEARDSHNVSLAMGWANAAETWRNHQFRTLDKIALLEQRLGADGGV